MSAPTFASVRTSIQGVVSGVAGIAGVATVHDYLRHAVDEKRAKELFKDRSAAGRLHFWAVCPSRGDPYNTTQFPGTHEKSMFAYEVHGYMALADADATEKILTELVELVIAAFRADKKLGNTVIGCTPAQWVTYEHVMFGEVLCHHVVLSIKARVQTEP